MAAPSAGTDARNRFARGPLDLAAACGGRAAARARRFHVWLLIGSGIVASAQIGKAIISIPMIAKEMALGFAGAGLVVAIFATLGALTGIGAAYFDDVCIKPCAVK